MEHLRFSSEPHAGPEEVAFGREALAWHNVAATRDFYFGMVSEWEEWTRMRFLESGLYVVPARNPWRWILNGTKAATKTRTSACGTRSPSLGRYRAGTSKS
jgi:hypothetical protein